MKKAEILMVAHKAVSGDRGKTHGDAYDNMRHTANLWNAYLDGRNAITPLDVAHMLVLHKQSRAMQGAGDFLDHYVDQCGYAAIAGEVATRAHDEKKRPSMSQSELDAAAREIEAAGGGMAYIKKLAKENGYEEVAAQNTEASTATLDGQPFVDCRGVHVHKGSVVKFFPTDSDWTVEEVLLADSGMHILRVRHYPSNREHEVLARNVHSIVEP